LDEEDEDDFVARLQNRVLPSCTYGDVCLFMEETRIV
jgi:hypothetical protein